VNWARVKCYLLPSYAQINLITSRKMVSSACAYEISIFTRFISGKIFMATVNLIHPSWIDFCVTVERTHFLTHSIFRTLWIIDISCRLCRNDRITSHATSNARIVFQAQLVKVFLLLWKMKSLHGGHNTPTFFPSLIHINPLHSIPNRLL